MPARQRTLVESEDYKDQIEKLGGAKDLDEALRALLWSLTLHAEAWPLAEGYRRLRLAWTIPNVGPVRRRAFQIWFEIRDDDNHIDLLYIEPFDL